MKSMKSDVFDKLNTISISTYVIIILVLFVTFYIIRLLCKKSTIENFDTGDLPAGAIQDLTKFQGGWQWCNKCSSIFFPGVTNINCAKGGTHDGSGSGTYYIAVTQNVPASNLNIQGGFSWCNRCSVLYYSSGTGIPSSCYDKNPHDSGGSGTYFLYSSSTATSLPADQQAGWLWCKNCGDIFFSAAPSYCSKTGASHDGSSSGKYIMFSGPSSTPAPAPTVNPITAGSQAPVVIVGDGYGGGPICLTVNGTSVSGTQSCNNADNQKWLLNGNQIQSYYSKGNCLDLANNNATVLPCSDTTNPNRTFSYVNGGWRQLKVGTGSCLDHNNGLRQWACGNDTNFQYTFPRTIPIDLLPNVPLYKQLNGAIVRINTNERGLYYGVTDAWHLTASSPFASTTGGSDQFTLTATSTTDNLFTISNQNAKYLFPGSQGDIVVNYGPGSGAIGDYGSPPSFKITQDDPSKNKFRIQLGAGNFLKGTDADARIFYTFSGQYNYGDPSVQLEIVQKSPYRTMYDTVSANKISCCQATYDPNNQTLNQAVCADLSLTPSSASCTALFQQTCSTGNTAFATNLCKQFCNDPANKAFCDTNVSNKCSATSNADPYCNCFKPMTSYPKYSGFAKIYDGLTECYVGDCISTDAYKLGKVKCPDCLQILDVSR